ncbi:MAG: UdgX family uracil-DNA binding protein [Nitrospiraceae bacterium]
MNTVAASSQFEIWFQAAQSLLDRHVPPNDIFWADQTSQPLLPGLLERVPPTATRVAPRRRELPEGFEAAARQVLIHRDKVKWPLLYRILWRLRHETSHLLRIVSDQDISLFRLLERQVRHDTYRMTQFVRFRRVEASDPEHFIAWHRPDHDVLRMAAPFFVNRFARQRWSILTPFSSAHWDRNTLIFTGGAPQHQSPTGDELESLWRTYYAAICNPARINPRAMTAQMPGRFWATLPEAGEIRPLLTQAKRRVSIMVGTQQNRSSATFFIPQQGDLAAMAHASRSCQGCELHIAATQTVFGQGPRVARIVLVGEQPGDEEDRQGVPFVGPAGNILNEALQDAGLGRDSVYLTNAVKHFRFIPAGRARRHQTPRPSHITACRPWLEAELSFIRPRLIVCLGATAARSLLGHAVRVIQGHGTIQSTEWAQGLMVTIHPAAVLRSAEERAGRRLYRTLVDDLRTAARFAQEPDGKSAPFLGESRPPEGADGR